MDQTFHISTSQFTAYSIATSGDTHILDTEAKITSATSGIAVETGFDGNTVKINGAIQTATGQIGVYDGATDTHILIGKTGSILSSFGIWTLNSDSEADIVNNGYIGSTDTAVLIQSSGEGRIVNNGEIIATTAGIVLTDIARDAFMIKNNGLIVASTGIMTVATDSEILLGKDSVIRASLAGIANYAHDGTVTSVVNEGLIQATNTSAYYGSSTGVDKIVNSGHIVGNVLLFGANDSFTDKGGKVDGLVAGGAGNDRFTVANSKLEIVENFGEGNDTLKSSVNYTMEVSAEIEKFVLTGKKNIDATGSDYNNAIQGNKGDNEINGRGGTDILTGGKGEDIFIFSPFGNDDTITDFKQGDDRIEITGFAGFEKFKDLDFTKDGTDVLIDFGNGDTLTIEDAKIKDFDKSDFIFA